MELGAKSKRKKLFRQDLQDWQDSKDAERKMLAQNPHKESESVNPSELAFPASSSFCFRASHPDCSAISFEPGEAFPSHIVRGLKYSIFTRFVE